MSRVLKKTIHKTVHEPPQRFWAQFILLPYGEFYDKTKGFLDAKTGDTLRFFNGPDCQITKVMLVEGQTACDCLSLVRYGVPWRVAYEKWLRYARMEGNGKDILSKDKCIFIVYAEDTV